MRFTAIAAELEGDLVKHTCGVDENGKLAGIVKTSCLQRVIFAS